MPISHGEALSFSDKISNEAPPEAIHGNHSLTQDSRSKPKEEMKKEENYALSMFDRMSTMDRIRKKEKPKEVPITLDLLTSPQVFHQVPPFHGQVRTIFTRPGTTLQAPLSSDGNNSKRNRLRPGTQQLKGLKDLTEPSLFQFTSSLAMGATPV